MHLQHRMSALVGITLLFATVSFAQQVKTDYDRSADFSRYKTYSWGNVHTQNQLFVDRIKAAVTSALTAKGWTEVDSGGDVSIMAMEMTKDHQTLNTYYDNFGGGGWGWALGRRLRRRLWYVNDDRADIQGWNAGRRPLRYQYEETALARFGERYPFRQIRQEHRKAQLGCEEAV